MSRIFAFSFGVFLSVVFSAFAFAHDYKSGNLIIEHPVIPATVKSAPVAAGYLSITNSGSEAERLTAIKSNFSGKTSIHEMKMIDGIMKMRPLTNGIEIPAGETVVLKKGADHLMFMQLQQQMEVGQLRKVTLVFETAGDIEVEMLVVDPADLDDGKKEDDHSSHSGHTH